MRFQVGDVIHIAKYRSFHDKEDRSGTILITEYLYPVKGTKNGMYQVEHLSGNITFLRYNVQMFDSLEYLHWLGNVHESPALRVLYGIKER